MNKQKLLRVKHCKCTIATQRVVIRSVQKPLVNYYILYTQAMIILFLSVTSSDIH